MQHLTSFMILPPLAKTTHIAESVPPSKIAAAAADHCRRPVFRLQADEQLRRAAARVDKGPDVYRRRVGFVQAGLDYQRRLMEIIGWMQSYWENKDEAVAAKVLANWEVI